LRIAKDLMRDRVDPIREMIVQVSGPAPLTRGRTDAQGAAHGAVVGKIASRRRAYNGS
jgi:hypothetical protein